VSHKVAGTSMNRRDETVTSASGVQGRVRLPSVHLTPARAEKKAASSLVDHQGIRLRALARRTCRPEPAGRYCSLNLIRKAEYTHFGPWPPYPTHPESRSSSVFNAASKKRIESLQRVKLTGRKQTGLPRSRCTITEARSSGDLWVSWPFVSDGKLSICQQSV
jgi:hypothetical protein